jgi:putative mRNA 3-end processing factor
VPLLELTADGLYCPAGRFHIDPWGPVDHAVITHAHSDHARPGARAYLATAATAPLLRARLPEASIQSIGYQESVTLGDVRVSFHPAGHILGSAQIRLDHRGEVWVVSGDYKLAPDPTCVPFEPLRCHTFVTESTFGLPIFRWSAEAQTIDAVHAWWRANQEAGKASLILAYALGKAQRLLASIDPSIGPIYAHGAVERVNRLYREQGIALAPTLAVPDAADYSGALIVAPPGWHNTPWSRRFGHVSAALVSGWMRIRGTRRRRSLDRGFVLSDHADWPALLRAIDESHAETVWVTHGFRAPLVRWLEEHGRRALSVEARFEGERDETPEEPAP